MDYLTELLRKDQLDETISLDNLEKSLNFFHHLYNVHLGEITLSFPMKLVGVVKKQSLKK